MSRAFIFPGQGSQWAGMGIWAYRHNARFRAHFENIDDYFRALADWSLREALAAYRSRDAWVARMRRGMGKDFSWDASARKYRDLYAGL